MFLWKISRGHFLLNISFLSNENNWWWTIIAGGIVQEFSRKSKQGNVKPGIFSPDTLDKSFYLQSAVKAQLGFGINFEVGIGRISWQFHWLILDFTVDLMKYACESDSSKPSTSKKAFYKRANIFDPIRGKSRTTVEPSRKNSERRYNSSGQDKMLKQGKHINIPLT